MTKKIPDNQSELSLYIPKEMKLKFKSICAVKELSMSEVVKTLIQGWINENE